MTPEEIQAIADGTQAYVKAQIDPVWNAVGAIGEGGNTNGAQIRVLADKLRDVVTALVAADGALAQRIAALEEGEPEVTQPPEPDGYEADRAELFGPAKPNEPIVLREPGPIESQRRERLRFMLTGRWSSAVIHERLSRAR